MFGLKVLGAVAAIALAVPTMTPTVAQAQHGAFRGGGGGGAAMRGPSIGGGAAMRGPSFSGSRSFSGPRAFGGSRAISGPRSFNRAVMGGSRVAAGARWSGRHGHRHHHRRYVYPGLIGGAIIGSSLAWPYYDPYYYDYYDAPVIESGASADEVAYCMRRFKSYDPRTGTYLGYDGLRHPCP